MVDFRDAGYAFSDPPVRLGERYRDAFARGPIRCFYNANVTDIGLHDCSTGWGTSR